MRYTFGDYILDTQRAELRGAGTPIKLRRKVLQVLAYLLAHHDRVVPKEELLEQLWPGQFVGDETLKSCLKTLSLALGERSRSPRFVRTLHGQGYRFVAPVKEGFDAPPGTAPPSLLPAPPLPEASPHPLLAADAPPAAFALFLPVPPFPPSTELPPSSQHLPAGERRQVTVLCGTLAHATALADRLGFATFQHLVQTFHTLAHECVQRYEGSIQPLGEEGVLALFGVHVAQEEHAWRAVRAALELLQQLRETSPGGALLPGEALTARVGVHTGGVVVGRTSDAPPRALVVGGDTVQGALCVQGLAEPGTLLVSDTTLRLLRAPVHSAAYGLVRMPGQTEPLMAYTVQGMDVPYATRAWGPFVGRQRGLADARHRKARGWEAWALWLLGEVARQGDPIDVATAAAHYRQALTLAEECGMCPLQAHCHLGLGTLYARTGQQAQAGVALSAAIELYRAMDMTFWLPQAEAALAQVA